MPVETLRPQGAVPFTSAMPFRLLNKGPDYFRLRHQVEPGSRKLSAVERLEADKAKYVKSHQVALTRQSPVKPPIIRKPLLSPGMMFQCRITAPPARKVPRRPADAENGGRDGLGGRRGPALNLEILNNLINNVCDVGPLPPGSSPSPVPSSSPSPAPSSPSASSPSSGAKSVGSGLSAEREAERSGRLLNNLRPCGTNTSSSTSSCTSSAPLPPPPAAALNNNNNNLQQSPPAEPCRRPPPVPARAPRGTAPPTPYGSSPNCVTVRRVDVRPQAELRRPQRAPLKPPLKPRPAALAQPQVAQPQAPPPPPPHQNLQPHVTTGHPLLPAFLPHSPMLLRAAAAVVGVVGIPPPASPAFTRLSNASSTRGSRTGGGSARKQHPALHRSKSDLSDRYSRATADLERFFNYCGLDPREVEGLGGVERFTAGRANSDIVSVSNKLRSVSTPSSECALAAAARGEGEGEEEDAGLAAANERVPYGISVIERNARVIKWLYGIRQARDVVTTSGGGVSNV